jgi:hypothetical protein
MRLVGTYYTDIAIIFVIQFREAPDILRPNFQQTAHQKAAGAASSN